MDLVTTFDMMKEAYNMKIFNQHLTYKIMTESYIEEATKDDNKSIFKRFNQWIKETAINIASTLRKWFAKIIDFLTKTIPNAIRSFFAKIVSFIKRKKKTKNINIPKNILQNFRGIIEKIVNNINKINNAKAVNEILIDEKKDDDEVINPTDMVAIDKDEIKEAEKKVQAQIESLPDLQLKEQKETMKEALHDGEMVTINNNDEKIKIIKCIPLKDPIKRSLSTIVEESRKFLNIFDQLTDQLGSVTPKLFVMVNPEESYKECESIYNEYIKNLEFGKFKTALKQDNMVIFRKDIKKMQPVDMRLDEIEKNIAEFSADKTGDKLKADAESKINNLLNILKDIDKEYTTSSHAEIGKQYIQLLRDICTKFMNFYTDAAKEYATYTKFAIDGYTAALAGKWNN